MNTRWIAIVLGGVLSLMSLLSFAGGSSVNPPIERFGENNMAVQFEMGYAIVDWLDFSGVDNTDVTRHEESGAIYGASVRYFMNHMVGVDLGMWIFPRLTTPNLSEGGIDANATHLTVLLRYAVSPVNLIAEIGPIYRSATGAYDASTSSLTQADAHMFSAVVSGAVEYPVRPDFNLFMRLAFSPKAKQSSKRLPAFYFASLGAAYTF